MKKTNKIPFYVAQYFANIFTQNEAKPSSNNVVFHTKGEKVCKQFLFSVCVHLLATAAKLVVLTIKPSKYKSITHIYLTSLSVISHLCNIPLFSL